MLQSHVIDIPKPNLNKSQTDGETGIVIETGTETDTETET